MCNIILFMQKRKKNCKLCVKNKKAAFSVQFFYLYLISSDKKNIFRKLMNNLIYIMNINQ